jgi:hypothetical protein
MPRRISLPPDFSGKNVVCPISRVTFALFGQGSRMEPCPKSHFCPKSIRLARKVSDSIRAMKRLIQHLGIALITFMLGLYSLNLREVLNPPPANRSIPILTNEKPSLLMPLTEGELTCPHATTHDKRPFLFHSDSLNLKQQRFVFIEKGNTQK